MVGNPPWIRNEWKISDVVSEYDPLVDIRKGYKYDLENLLNKNSGMKNALFSHYEQVATVQNFNAAPMNYELLDKQPGNLYKLFDKNICSVRIDDTYRGIVVREPKSNVYILLWVDHHDEAYAWAKRKKCSINKLTGSVQIFDVQEVIEEQNTIDEPALFANISDEVFEKIGLPEEQFPMIKAIKTLEGLHSLKAAIPEDAFEGLEWLGNGFTVEEVLDTLYPEIEHVEVKENDFAAALQTDVSKKSFVIVEGEEELQAIMQEPLEKWRIFLHPTQRKIVDKKFNGPARVLGGAGTGKTVVAMHRAKMLAANLESDVSHLLMEISLKLRNLLLRRKNLITWLVEFMNWKKQA